MASFSKAFVTYERSNPIKLDTPKESGSYMRETARGVVRFNPSMRKTGAVNDQKSNLNCRKLLGGYTWDINFICDLIAKWIYMSNGIDGRC